MTTTRAPKPRAPYPTAAPAGSIRTGPGVGIERHFALCLAVEALARTVGAMPDSASWDGRASVTIAFDPGGRRPVLDERLGEGGLADGGALSLAVFEGDVVRRGGGGDDPASAAVTDVTLDALMEEGRLEEFRELLFGKATRDGPEDWALDDVALGINFSRLHRIALSVEVAARETLHRLADELETAMGSAAGLATGQGEAGGGADAGTGVASGAEDVKEAQAR